MFHNHSTAKIFAEAQMRTFQNAAVVLSAALALAACGGGEDAAPGVRTEVVDGVTLVHNPAAPLHPDKTVRFELEMSFATAEEGPGAVFKPGAFAIDGSGRVLIYDASDRAVKVFDPDGRHLRTIGRAGEGPGEFQSVFYMGCLPDGGLLIMDAQARRTSIFGPDGNFSSSYQWTTSISSPCLVGAGEYTVRETVRRENVSELYLKTHDFGGREIRAWGRFTMPEFRTVTQRMGEGAVTMGVSVPQSPRSILAGDDARGRVYHCLNSAYLIEVYDGEGRLVRKIDRPYEPQPFTDRDRQEILDRSASNPNTKALYEGMTFPAVKTVTEKIFADDRGDLWLMTAETKPGAATTLTAFDIFDIDGVYDARVWLEAVPGSWVFVGGKLYRYAEDPESGLRRLNRYAVIWETASRPE